MKSVLAMLTLGMANLGSSPRGYELTFANNDTCEQERSAA